MKSSAPTCRSGGLQNRPLPSPPLRSKSSAPLQVLRSEFGQTNPMAVEPLDSSQASNHICHAAFQISPFPGCPLGYFHSSQQEQDSDAG